MIDEFVDFPNAIDGIDNIDSSDLSVPSITDGQLPNSIESGFNSIKDSGSIEQLTSIQYSGIDVNQHGCVAQLSDDSVNTALAVSHAFEDVNNMTENHLEPSTDTMLDNPGWILEPSVASLNITREEIDTLSDKANGIERADNHSSDISFGKKEPGDCLSRHGCTGAKECDKCYGDF